MSKIKTILSIIFIFTIWGCVSSAYPILLWWSRECVLYLIIIIKPEVWIINHCLGLGHETMVCAVCLTVFLCSYPMFEQFRMIFSISPDKVLIPHPAYTVGLRLASKSTTLKKYSQISDANFRASIFWKQKQYDKKVYKSAVISTGLSDQCSMLLYYMLYADQGPYH